MGIFKKLVGDAINEGISKGIKKAVEGTVEKAIKPTVDQFVATATSSINEASEALQNNKELNKEENQEALQSLANLYKDSLTGLQEELDEQQIESAMEKQQAKIIFDTVLKNFPKWHEEIDSVQVEEYDERVCVYLYSFGTEFTIQKYQAELILNGFINDGGIYSKVIANHRHLVDFEDCLQDSKINITYGIDK